MLGRGSPCPNLCQPRLPPFIPSLSAKSTLIYLIYSSLIYHLFDIGITHISIIYLIDLFTTYLSFIQPFHRIYLVFIWYLYHCIIYMLSSSQAHHLSNRFFTYQSSILSIYHIFNSIHFSFEQFWRQFHKKISLFDKMSEIFSEQKYQIGQVWSSSPLVCHHRMFLFQIDLSSGSACLFTFPVVCISVRE